MAILMLLILNACGGGGGVMRPAPAIPQPEQPEPEPAAEQGSEDGSGSGPESQPGVGSDIGDFPPFGSWERNDAYWERVYFQWYDPRTGETENCKIERFGNAVVEFKPEGWWIEEDYPIDENTPPWKLHEDAAVEELRSRGFMMPPEWQWQDPRAPEHRWSLRLRKDMVYSDFDQLYADFPCIREVWEDRLAVAILFKPDKWWIEEDYPIDENTPPWKLHEDAAVEELMSRGYGVSQLMSALEPMPRYYGVGLHERMTFFDVDDELPEEFPCIFTVIPYILPIAYLL